MTAISPTLARETSEAPPPFISPEEWVEGSRLFHPARRRQWLAGRLAVKRAIVAALGPVGHRPAAAGWLDAVTVRSRDGAGCGTRPSAARAGRPLPVSVAISHLDDLAVGAAVAGADWRLGVDLARQGLGRGGQPVASAWRWAAFEAALKACGRLDLPASAVAIQRHGSRLLVSLAGVSGQLRGWRRRLTTPAGPTWLVVGLWHEAPPRPGDTTGARLGGVMAEPRIELAFVGRSELAAAYDGQVS